MGSHHPIRKTVAPEPVAIPDKLYFRIGDVARLCDVPPYVLRFWETEFPQLKPNKGGTGQRLYRKKDVEMALRIKSLLYDQGYTIPGARQVFKTGTAPAEQPATEAASSAEPAPKLGATHLASEMWAGRGAQPPATYDRRAELRLRAHLADLRDELQSVLEQLSQASHAGTAEHAATSPAASALAEMPESKPRPRLVLEPKPALKSLAQTTLHLTTQGDLFSAE